MKAHLVIAGALAAGLLGATGANAAALVVQNASFEASPLSDGGYVAGFVDGWRAGGNVGWQNPAASILTSVPHGQNTAWLGTQAGLYPPGVLSQMVAASVLANTEYTLDVDVGRRFDIALSPFVVELLAGDDVVASGSYAQSDIDPGAFRGLTLNWTSTQAAAAPLTIRFRVTSPTTAYSQVNFDNVRMDATSLAAAVPEPATWALMIVGFGSAGAMLRRRRALVVA